MKKLLIFLLTPILTLFIALSGLSVRSLAKADASAMPATGDYACILSDEVYFYSTPDERRGVFLLPRTYYVRLLEYGNDFCRIEYLYDDGAAKRLTGYAKTDELTFVDYVPARPYLYYVFDVKYRIDDAQIQTSDFLTEITVSCAYYGDYFVGSETYCYVLRDGEFGYIPKPTSLRFERNTEYEDYVANLEQSAESETSETETATPSKSSPAQIAILVAICLLVPILAALILKPPKRPPYEDAE